jgi:hypothetical protein
MTSYAELLDPKSFAGDEPVRVFVSWPARAENDKPIRECWVSERLFARLVLLGRAYSLHFGQIVDLDSETSLNHTQCEVLSDELEFLTTLVSDLDHALREGIRAISALAGIAVQGQHELHFEPP